MKSIIYIDGQNFLYKAAGVLIDAGRITDKQELHTFDFTSLFSGLIQADEVEIRYYGTRLKKYKQSPEITEKAVAMIDSQRRLRNNLGKQRITFIEAGKLKLRDGDKCKNCGQQDLHFQEKGVDVRIAVDMLMDAQNKTADSFVLVSSDTDLLPPIQAMRKLESEVIYVGFSDKLTKALLENASATQIIRDPEIIAAYDAANPQTTIKAS